MIDREEAIAEADKEEVEVGNIVAEVLNEFEKTILSVAPVIVHLKTKEKIPNDGLMIDSMLVTVTRIAIINNMNVMVDLVDVNVVVWAFAAAKNHSRMILWMRNVFEGRLLEPKAFPPFGENHQLDRKSKLLQMPRSIKN